MGRCHNLIDEGIKEILKVSGCKLRVLGIGILEGAKSLHERVYRATDGGIKDIPTVSRL